MLWQISVTVACEAEEAVADLLDRLFCQAATVYTVEGGTSSVVTVYTSQRSEVVRKKQIELRAGLKAIVSCDLDIGPGKIVLRKVPLEDWAHSWKKHFKTIEIGRQLVIRPSWIKRKLRKGVAVVTLDPGLSFGTGQHPTTRFCLEQLVNGRETGLYQLVLRHWHRLGNPRYLSSEARLSARAGH